jgi:hypothetical protein
MLRARIIVMEEGFPGQARPLVLFCILPNV